MTTSLFREIEAAGIPFSNHESDLYIPNTQKARDILAKFPDQHKNARLFINQAPPNKGESWIEIPFAYLPWWEKRAKK